MGRLPEADQEWLFALQLDPTNVGAASNRAAVLAETGRTAEALAILEPIHRQIPQEPGVLKNLVLTYLKMNNKQAALQRVQETLRVDPNNAMARALLQDLSK
jgi:Flp pilus assembly protein TadD